MLDRVVLPMLATLLPAAVAALAVMCIWRAAFYVLSHVVAPAAGM